MRDAQRTQCVDLELAPDRNEIKVIERYAFENAGIVDQQVDRTGFDRLCKSLDGRAVGYVVTLMNMNLQVF